MLKAEKAYSKAVGLRPNFLEAHYQRTRILRFRDDSIWRSSEIMTVLRLVPEFKKPTTCMVSSAATRKTGDEAIYGFSEFIKRDDFNWADTMISPGSTSEKEITRRRDTAQEGLKRAETNPWLQNIYGAAP